MGPRAGVFLHNGLGDGVNCLVLTNNLQLNGWKVDTYQNAIGPMQSWFPHIPVQSYPPLSELSRILNTYDWFFAVHNNTDEFVLKLIEEGKRRFPSRLKVIYLYPSPRIVNEPYYSDCLTEPHLSIAENLRLFCERILRLPKITRSNGFIPPAGLVHRRFPKRIAIHPTSARLTRNWPREKFVKLALHLKSEGYQLAFILSEETQPASPSLRQSAAFFQEHPPLDRAKEREVWKEVLDLGFEMPVFQNLDLLARFFYESGYLIGNDSGPGHLASALHIPTLTICRRKKWAQMWSPSFAKGIVVTPNSWIPNIKGLRLRDRYWQKFISVGMARRAFERLVKQ